jgi:hypothetical protein
VRDKTLGYTVMEMRAHEFTCLACGQLGVGTSPNRKYHTTRACRLVRDREDRQRAKLRVARKQRERAGVM